MAFFLLLREWIPEQIINDLWAIRDPSPVTMVFLLLLSYPSAQAFA